MAWDMGKNEMNGLGRANTHIARLRNSEAPGDGAEGAKHRMRSAWPPAARAATAALLVGEWRRRCTSGT